MNQTPIHHRRAIGLAICIALAFLPLAGCTKKEAAEKEEHAEKKDENIVTLTKELFVPGFLERDEGEREQPYAKYPWDGISGVKPWRGIAATTTVGVY